MMKTFMFPLVLLLAACSAKEETAQQVADRWCELHKAVLNAESEKDKEKAEEAKKSFEREVETKYKNDEKFLQEVDEKVEACEEAQGSDYDGD